MWRWCRSQIIRAAGNFLQGERLLDSSNRARDGSSILVSASLLSTMSLHPVAPSMRPLLRQGLSLSRSFSTTPAVLSNKVPPESPSYIRLPPPPQSDETKPARVRGHLPVPREIFPRSEGGRKLRPEYILQTAPLPKKPHADEWKTTMAQTRRDNLQQGLRELYDRQSRDEKFRNARSAQRFRENRKAAAAPERKDDVLTRGTVLSGVFDTKLYPDPNRFKRASKAQLRVKRKEAGKSQARREAIMALYINAADFITTEAALKTEIDSIFTDEYFRSRSNSNERYGAVDNVWGSFGRPTTLGQMMEVVPGSSTRVVDVYSTEHGKTSQKQKTIAEELTGGKMP